MPEPTRTSERGRWRVLEFAELDSTNRYLRAAAADGAPDGLVVVADHQTAGRGRLDRRWEAPPGSSLLVSVLLRSVADPGRAVMAAGVALARALEQTVELNAWLKWPNDLVIDDRKLAGLLAEREGDALVVGVGCNVNWESFPPELAATATACNLEVGHAVDADALLVAYLAQLSDALGSPVVPLRDHYRGRLATLGRRVRVELPGTAFLEGVATDLDERGALVVRDAAGVDHAVTAGDVVHLRTA